MEWRFNPVNAAVYAMVSKEIELEQIKVESYLEDLDQGARAIFKGPKIEKVYLGGGESPRGLMCQGLIYPSDDYDYPSFGYDWAVFAKPQAYVFAFVDLHPLRREKKYGERYLQPIEVVYDKYERFHPYQMAQRAEWSKPFRSGHGYLGRLPVENIGDSINLIVDYLEIWLHFWREAKPQKDPKLRDQTLAQKEAMREAYKSHGTGTYTKRYGKEIANKLMDLLYGKQF